MHLIVHDDLTPESMAAHMEESLPAQHTTLLLLHLTLFQRSGCTILDRLQQVGRPGSMCDQVLRYVHRLGIFIFCI